MSKAVVFANLRLVFNFIVMLILNLHTVFFSFLPRKISSTRSLVCAALLFVVSISASLACTDDEQCIEENQWSIGVALGLGASTNPVVDGDAIPQVILLDIAWYGEQAYFDNGELGIRWLDTSDFGLESYVTLDRERAYFSFWDPANILVNTGFSPLDGELSGELDSETQGVKVSIDQIDSKKWAVLAGTRLNYYQGSQKWSLGIETDVSGVHGGQRVSIAYQKAWSGDDWRFQIRPNIIWKSDDLVDYYYGLDVRPTTLSRIVYKGKGGFQPGVSLLYTKELTNDWQFISSASYQHLHSGMTDSPLVRHKQVMSIFVGAGYRF